MLVHWIWLAHRPQISDWLRWRILQRYGDPEAVYFADDYETIEDLTPGGKKSLEDKDLASSEKILENCLKYRLSILTIQDAAYPDRLKNIPDPPIVLYYKGRMPDLEANAAIAVVGTRDASPYGLAAARRLGYEVGRCGGILVSGMAKGIDARAMQAALTADAPVVGVLGCGPEQIYPRSNRALFEDTERYGCILSEFPPETPPLPSNFPRRNRIISGLSCGVLVVEAPMRSGALITARLAADQGRDVFVVPGNIGLTVCEGSNSLLRDGAIAVSCGWDILSEYEGLYPGKLHCYRDRRTGLDYPPARDGDPQKKKEKKADPEENQEKNPEDTGSQRALLENSRNKCDKKVIDNPAPQPYIDINEILSKCDPQEQTILKALQSGEKLVDNLIAETGLAAQTVLSSLTMLEIKGAVRRLPGRRISLRQK